MKILTAEPSDLPSVMCVAGALQLRPGQNSSGFLISNFPQAKYEELLGLKEHGRFLVAKTAEDQVSGFLIAYDRDYVLRAQPGASELGILNRPQGRAAFWIVKQIAVDPAYQRMGIARALMQHLLADVRGEYVFSSIVAKPQNLPSEEFHKSFGFAKLFDAVSRDVSSGVSYENSVWCRSISSHA